MVAVTGFQRPFAMAFASDGTLYVTTDRDPKGAHGPMAGTIWRVDVSAGAVMGRWAAIVGPEVAQHATPVAFDDGELLVRADSTAWATELRLQSQALLARLEEEAGKGVVVGLRIVGPSAPSWGIRPGSSRPSGGRPAPGP